MRKWSLWLALGLAVQFFGLWPFPRVDTGDLYIVETLLVESTAEGLRLSTGEASGVGSGMAEAVADLERGTPGQLFLRQTARLVFCGGGERDWDWQALPEDLPYGAVVYRYPGAASDLELEILEQVLAAGELREAELPTLAMAKNEVLRGLRPSLTEIQREGQYAE